MISWRILPIPQKISGDLITIDAAMNMAIDEAILNAVKEGYANPTIRFYRWDPPAISIGNRNAAGIVNQEACRGDGTQFVRRPTGGNAVYHGRGDLTYAVIAPNSLFPSEELSKGSNRAAYKTICGWIIDALEEIGLEGTLEKDNNILVQGNKVVGSAQLPGHVFLQQGAIFYASTAEDWINHLQYPAEALRAIRPISSFTSRTADEFYQALLSSFGNNDTVQSAQMGVLSEQEWEYAIRARRTYSGREHFCNTKIATPGKVCAVHLKTVSE